MRGKYEVFFLVGDIKGLTFKFDGYKHPSHAFHDDERYFYRYYQMVQTTNPQYIETFKNKVSVIDSYGGAIGTDLGLAKE